MRYGISLLLVSLWLVNSVVGFDTAPHFDLTHGVLAESGFGAAAIQSAQVQNWMTDYYASAPALRSRREQRLLEQLHCDNLYSVGDVRQYWGWLLHNLKTASQQAARDAQPLDTLALLALSLHAVQDFYAHSNWVELHPRNGDAYRTETLLSDPAGLDARLVTGKYPARRQSGPGGAAIPLGAVLHGDYAEGLNKDSPIRPRWDEAYVFAYVASHELLDLLEKWSEEAQPGYWQRVQRWQGSAGEQVKLEMDLVAARNISMWVALDERADGHWKGDRSGAHHLFTAFLGKWETGGDSLFARQIKQGRLLAQLADNLYAAAPAPALPKMSGFALRRRAVVVQTTSIRALNESGGLLGRLERIDPNNEADFYAVFYLGGRVGGQSYRERVIQGADNVANPWCVIHFMDATLAELPLNIAVWDEDESEPGGGFRDDRVDINPQPNKYDLDWVISAAAPGRTFSSSGAKPDRNRAAIGFTVRQIPLR